MTTGEMIKDLLEKTGKKQADLARYLGVNPNTVNLWMPKENKKAVEPSEKNLKKIAEFFQVPIDVLKGKAGEIDSIKWYKFSQVKERKFESFELFLESLGYEIEPSVFNKTTGTFDLSKEYKITWKDEDGTNFSIIKGIDFDIFLAKLEKHIKIEIENYY